MKTCGNCENTPVNKEVKIRAEITLDGHVEITEGTMPLCDACFEEACNPVTGATAKLREALVAYGTLIEEASKTEDEDEVVSACLCFKF